MRYQEHLNWSCMLAALVIFTSLEPAQGFSVINMDTTINGNQEDDVTVIDGATPPTVVDIVAPAALEEGLEAFGSSIVNFRGGSVDERVRMFDNSVLNVTGGNFREGIIGSGSSRINVTDVDDTDSIFVNDTSTAAVSGGKVWSVWATGQGIIALDGGNLYAYPHEPGLVADESGTIHVFGSGFNFPLGALTASTGTLTGFLADGQPILTDFSISGKGSIVLGLPLPGDTNADRRVDMIDLNNVRNGFAGVGAADGTLPGDAFPFDGVVDVNDLNAVRNHFGAGITPVPEPAAAAMALLGIVCTLSLPPRRGVAKALKL